MNFLGRYLVLRYLNYRGVEMRFFKFYEKFVQNFFDFLHELNRRIKFKIVCNDFSKKFCFISFWAEGGLNWVLSEAFQFL